MGNALATVKQELPGVTPLFMEQSYARSLLREASTKSATPTRRAPCLWTTAPQRSSISTKSRK